MKSRPHPEIISAYAEEILQIPFFAHCGEKPLPKYAFPVKFCPRSTAAVKVRGTVWSDIRLEEVNQLTDYLFHQKPELYQYNDHYNELVIALKQTYIQPLTEKLTPVSQEILGIDAEKVLLFGLQWDVLHDLIGKYYEPYFRLQLYPELMDVYRSGHLPVGWNGAYPDGELLVY